jgi:hypothetical protein
LARSLIQILLNGVCNNNSWIDGDPYSRGS